MKQPDWVDDDGNYQEYMAHKDSKQQKWDVDNEGQIQEWVVDDDRQERFEIGR